MNLQIAIDGPAGAGKSTVGLRLARALECAYLDTGLMYRAVTRFALDRGIPLDAGEELGALARSTHFQLGSGDAYLLANGRETGEELRSADVDAAVSAVSAHAPVRAALVAHQRLIAERGCIVMVGRDIGTTVLPAAQLKLWVTASPRERARRRLQEQLPGSQGVDLEAVAEQIRSRDWQDAGRATSPLQRANDAVVLDTDGRTPEEVEAAALSSVQSAVRDAEGSNAACGGEANRFSTAPVVHTEGGQKAEES